jgi:hypothetical protein
MQERKKEGRRDNLIEKINLKGERMLSIFIFICIFIFPTFSEEMVLTKIA